MTTPRLTAAFLLAWSLAAFARANDGPTLADIPYKAALPRAGDLSEHEAITNEG